jgi:hypothetical protein
MRGNGHQDSPEGGGEERVRPAGVRYSLRELTDQLGTELHAARTELSECRLEAERLQARLEALEQEHRQACERHSALEREVAELWSQCVVMERVHGAIEHHEVLAAVQDVVINVIGSEELALYEPSPDGRWLRPVQCFGVESRDLGPVAVGSGPVGRAAADRVAWIAGVAPPPGEAPDLTACVPLLLGDRLMGVLAIWRMLAHKPTLGPADRGALDLLARHAATALFLTGQRDRGGSCAGLH